MTPIMTTLIHHCPPDEAQACVNRLGGLRYLIHPTTPSRALRFGAGPVVLGVLLERHPGQLIYFPQAKAFLKAQRYQKILEWADAGISFSVIAERIGFTETKVRWIWRDHK